MSSLRSLVGVFALLVTIGSIPVALAAPVAGAVLTAKGECFADAGGQRRPLGTGDEVHVGEIVEVPDGAKLKLRMVDGTVISAASGSRLTIDAYSADGAGHRDVKLDLATGLLRAVVSKMDAGAHFEVDTATGVAAVRGTDWFITVTSDSTQVGVLDGRVALTSVATHHEVEIPSHWGARVEAGKDPVPPRMWRQDEFDAVIDRTNLD